MKFHQNRHIIYFILGLLVTTKYVQFIQSFQDGVYLFSLRYYKKFENIGIKQCAKRCFAETECQSINFLKSKFICTLDYYNSSQPGFSLKSDPNYMYGNRDHMSKVNK